METQEFLQQIKPLDQTGRIRAHKQAQEALAHWIGTIPTREQFAHHASNKYPRSVQMSITIICCILLGAAFVPSAIRLYQVGSQTFGVSINEASSMIAVGLATILLAETGQVGFMLALNVLNDKTSKQAKFLLYTSALASTGVALIGNLQVVSPWQAGMAFAWVEAIVPPLLVLTTSYVLKEQMLEAIAQRYANEQAYQQAYHAWKLETSNLEQHPDWLRFYSNALLDTITRFNRSKLAKETLHALNDLQKLALFQREQQAELWYVQAVDQQELVALQASVVQANRSKSGGGSHTGEVDNARFEMMDNLHVATCPRCSKVMPGKPSKLQASRALAAHIGKAHRNEGV
jgi:hypothetical protein